MNPPNQRPQPRYQKIRELGRRESGDRITFLAQDRATGKTVVIKQFPFGKTSPDWAGAKAYIDDYRRLSQLDLPRIPSYLNFLPAKDGFCLIRDYHPGQSLAEFGAIELEQWKQIALSLLETLVELQNQTPGLIHRNIKPENIFVDDSLNPSLVDFGMAYIDSRGKRREATAGTPGFMPREQLQNKELSEATDLYGLGATLIAVLSQQASSDMERLLRADSNIDLTAILPKGVSFELVDWLKTMTQIAPHRRFKNAAAALEALQNIEVQRSPEVQLTPDRLDFIAAEYGEQLTATVTVRNPVPDTLLQGMWEVPPRPSESGSRSHRTKWIAIQPSQFESNALDCQVAIDTRKLMPEATYEQDILLRTNDRAQTHAIALRVLTAPLLSEQLPWLPLLGVFCLACLCGFLGTLVAGSPDAELADLRWMTLIAGIAIGGVGGMSGIFGLWAFFGGLLPIPWVVRRVLRRSLSGFYLFLGVGFGLGLVCFGLAGYVARFTFGKELPEGLSGLLSVNALLSGLIAAFGLGLGMAFKLGLGYPPVLPILAVTGIPMAILLGFKYSQQAQRLARYRKAKPYLVKP